jgi:DNA repair protein RecO (recombination protein O)
MRFDDEGIMLTLRRHGEYGAIATLLTAHRGLCHGYAPRARGAKTAAVYQIGNHIQAVWHGRLTDQLGTWTCELHHAFAPLVWEYPTTLAAMTGVCTLLADTLSEHEPHPTLFTGLCALLHRMSLHADHVERWLGWYVRFELYVLSALGFGLETTECTVTHTTENVCYLSPRSGKAVSEAVGRPYATHLFQLPALLRAPLHHAVVDCGMALQSLAITGYFLEKWVLQPRNRTLPQARQHCIARLKVSADGKQPT